MVEVRDQSEEHWHNDEKSAEDTSVTDATWLGVPLLESGQDTVESEQPHEEHRSEGSLYHPCYVVQRPTELAIGAVV